MNGLNHMEVKIMTKIKVEVMTRDMMMKTTKLMTMIRIRMMRKSIMTNSMMMRISQFHNQSKKEPNLWLWKFLTRITSLSPN